MFYRVVSSSKNVDKFVPSTRLAKELASMGFGDFIDEALSGMFELESDDGSIVLTVVKG